jgi:hypothetical protein
MGLSGQRFTTGERTPGTHCTGGWFGPRAGLGTEARGKILSSLPGYPYIPPVNVTNINIIYTNVFYIFI